jgi:hypothetical protein
VPRSLSSTDGASGVVPEADDGAGRWERSKSNSQRTAGDTAPVIRGESLIENPGFCGYTVPTTAFQGPQERAVRTEWK